jgi:predicted phosphodiesterase
MQGIKGLKLNIMNKLRFQNIGKIEADRILIFGGCYGNLEATEALFEEADRLNIPNKHIFCTGDLVAYCADPVDVSSLIRDKKINAIQGNCEQSLEQNDESCGCGFKKGTTCEALSQSWFSYCKNHISKDIINWYASLPHHIGFTFGRKRFLIVHGSLNNISEFVFSSNVNKNSIQDANVDCIIGGHSGLPFTKIMDNLCWHNSGVIGMPANDGTERVWYSVITRADTTITFEHKALHYPAKIAQKKMKDAKLPSGYIQAITSGLWPSLDVLLESEMKQTGQPLTEYSEIWNIK